MLPILNQTLLSLILGGTNRSNETSSLADSWSTKVVTKCKLEFDTRISYCGSFDSIMYGVVHHADRNQPAYFSRENCERLKKNGFFYFEGQKILMKRPRFDSFEIVMKGEANSHGGCIGARFKYQGREFRRHVLVKNLQVSITTETFPVVNDMLIIGFMRIPITNKWFHGNDYTLIW